MKVQGVEIRGDAMEWAWRWHEIACNPFVASDVESWADKELPLVLPGLPSHARRSDVARRLANRLIQKGRRRSLWSFGEGRWNVNLTPGGEGSA